MENKCICPGVNVFMCGCRGCECGNEGCEESGRVDCKCVQGVYRITVGAGGDFSTLREALKSVKNTTCNSALITLVSDVVEEGEETLAIYAHSGYPAIIIQGNNHVLDISSITANYGISLYGETLRILNLTIYAANVAKAVIGAGGVCNLHFPQTDFKLVGGGTEKGQMGIYIYHSGNCIISGVGLNQTIKDCKTGIKAEYNSKVNIERPITFENVGVHLSPDKETLGNKNSFIATHY